MINKYIFDYRLVLEENPSFKRFINTNDFIEDRSKCSSYQSFNDLVTKPEVNNKIEDEIINFAHDKEGVSINNRDVGLQILQDEALEEEPIKRTELKQEYKDPPNPNYDSSILQLPPPNRFLLPESEAWQGEYTLYKFNNSHVFDANNFICIMDKYRFSQIDHFIRLQHAVYRFDRKRNVTNELKKHLTIWTYNTKTKQLYKIRKVKKDALKKGSHFRNSVKKALNTLSNTGWHDMPERIINKFINTILEAAKKDVPDIVILDKETLKSDSPKASKTHNIIIENKYIEKMRERKHRIMKLASIILQHRVGQPIKWLNYTLMENMWDILGDLQFQEKVLFGIYNYRHNGRGEDVLLKAKALRKKTVYQLIPNLRKSNHMKTAIKTILGKGYSKFLIKLFNADPMNNTFIIEWLSAMNKGLISKNLYHWVVQTINTNSSSEVVAHITNNVIRILELIFRNYNGLEAYNANFDLDQFSVILDSYIKMYKKIVAVDVSPPRWDTWYDMYNMASQLGIRIRPNKLESSNKIRQLHDRLSDIINRDKVTIKKYKNSTFEEFISPDKKYDGFEFIQMRTAQDLVDEGTAMHHCIGSYADKCANGRSIIFSMRKDEKGYVTIELNTINYKVNQQYTLHDITVTNQEALNIINRWNDDCIGLHKNDKENYYEIRQKKVRAYLDKEKEKSLKELIKDGIADSELQILRGHQHEGEQILYDTAF